MKKARRNIAGLPVITYRELLNLSHEQETEAASLFATDTSEHNSDDEYEMADLTEPLNEEHLVDLSRLIATIRDLRTLGIEALKLPPSIIDSALTNNPRDIHEAAYSVLSEWWKWQEHPVAAFRNLVTALRKCRMKKPQLLAFTQKRHSTDVIPSVSPTDASPTNDPSHQQLEQREHAQVAQAAALQYDDLPEPLEDVRAVPSLQAEAQGAKTSNDSQKVLAFGLCGGEQCRSIQKEIEEKKLERTEEYDEPLNDVHLVTLSSLITSPIDLRTLGIKGLKLPPSIIQSTLTDNAGAIQEAAYSVLSTWRKRYKDPVAAFNDLVTALRKCRMYKFASNLTEGVQKRHPKDATAPSSAGPADASPISNSSHQQQEQREGADAAVVQSDDLPESSNAVHLAKLSRSITTPTELKTLGIESLKIPESNIQSALTNNRGDIRAAAYRVLSTWRKKYEDPSEAFRDLVAALEKCDMNQYASQLQPHPQAGPSSDGPGTVTNRKSPKTTDSEPLLAPRQVNTIKFIIPVFSSILSIQHDWC